MNDIRCGECRRKPVAGTCLRLSIKCQRCGALSHLRAVRPTSRTRT